MKDNIFNIFVMSGVALQENSEYLMVSHPDLREILKRNPEVMIINCSGKISSQEIISTFRVYGDIYETIIFVSEIWNFYQSVFEAFASIPNVGEDMSPASMEQFDVKPAEKGGIPIPLIKFGNHSNMSLYTGKVPIAA